MSDAFVDTNVLLRLLLYDSPEPAEAVERYMRRARAAGDRLIVTPATFSEVVFALLRGRRRYSREQTVLALEAILILPLVILDRPIMQAALALYRDHHNDWDDCLLAAYATVQAEGRIVSFDRGLGRVPGVALVQPA